MSKLTIKENNRAVPSQTVETDSLQEDEGGRELASPAQKQRMNEKRELRDLNQRLEMFIRYQKDGRSEVDRLRKLLAETEVDFRQRIKDSEKHYQLLQDKIIAENEQLSIHNKTLREQFENAEKARQGVEGRCVNLDQMVTRKDTELELKDQKLQSLQNQLEALTNELIQVKASIKASSKNDEQMVEQLQQQCEQWKSKFETTCEELAKTKSRHKCEIDTYQRALSDKTEENEKLKGQLKEHTKKAQELEGQVRKEFDTKMGEFVEKRELQYQSEKEEWMKIFKEEFHKKISQYKEANVQFAETTKKFESEMNELKARITRFRREKAELEAEKRSLEEDLEKSHNDLDELRQRKDEDIREKTQLIVTLQDTIKQKDMQFDVLSGAKVQLDNEIALYRSILSEAEKEAGYFSPLGSGSKKRKTDNGDAHAVDTPGSARARQVARQDLQNVRNEDSHWASESEQESENEDDLRQNDENKNLSNTIDGKNNKNNAANNDSANNFSRKRNCPEPNDLQNNKKSQINGAKNNGLDSNATPGETYPLQFSTMDLCSSTLEVQNVSEHAIALEGFYLTNLDKSKNFPLPPDRVLEPRERVKIIVGNGSDLRVADEDIWWNENVWSGTKDEIARLYDPNNQEISRIEISPEMIPEKVRTRKNCLIM